MFKYKFIIEKLAVGETALIEVIERDDGSGVTNEQSVRSAVYQLRKKTGWGLVTRKTPVGIYVTRRT